MSPANDPLPDGPRADVPPAPASSAPPAAPPAPGAPTVEGAAPREGSFLVRDGPLMLLALVLAVMIWSLVRDTIATDQKVYGVQVGVEGPSDVVVYEADRLETDVTLRGTQGDVDRARAALGNSPRVRLRLPVSDTRQKQGTRTFYSSDLFVFPFENTAVVSSVTPVTVQWEKAVERDVPVEAKVAVPADMRYQTSQVTVDPPTVRVRGPASVVEGLRTIPLDAVDASEFLKTNSDLTIAWQTTAGFGEWKRDGAWSGRPSDARRDPGLLTVLPDRVSLAVKFREVKSEKLDHVLLPIGPADDVSGWVYEFNGGADFTPPNRLTLPVKADAAVIEHMKQFPGEWSFAVVLPVPPDTGEVFKDKPLPVHLDVWGPALREKIARAGGVAPSIEGEAIVLLTITKRP